MLRGLAYNACTIVVTAVHFSSSLGPNRSEPEKNGTKGKYARTHARTSELAVCQQSGLAYLDTAS